MEPKRWNRFFLETEPAEPNRLLNNRLYEPNHAYEAENWNLTEPNRIVTMLE